MLGLMDKLTNFLMPEEDEKPVAQSVQERRNRLKLHTPAALKVFVVSPQTFDEAPGLADYLVINTAIVVNFEKTNVDLQRRITDFLNGVSYVIGANVERISNYIFIYVPPYVDVTKELYSYSIPPYVKQDDEM